MMVLKRIKELREDNDKTQKELANYLNIAQNTYSQYENGNRSLPLDCLVKLCKYYDVSADYLLGLSNEKHPQSLKHKM